VDAKEFQPKAFYRKFDALLSEIGRTSAKDINVLVLEQIMNLFAPDLRIRSGSLYRNKGGTYHKVKGPVGDRADSWPDFFLRADEAVQLVVQHKSYIFVEGTQPPWGPNSVGVVIGEENQFLMAFRLESGWEREILELSLNAIRNTLNYIRTSRRVGAVFQEAQEIQKSLLPKSDPVFEGYDIAGRSLPAELVGGDLYDYIAFDQEVLGIAIGDASGHGLPAALLARDVLTGLRMGAEREFKISGLLAKLNRVINASTLSTRFISLVFGELERNGTFVYVNAGHNPPMLLKGSGIEELSTGGTILGPVPDAVFRRGFAFIERGDVMVLYTDGLVEREDPGGEPFDKKRLIETVREYRDRPALAIVDEIFIRTYHYGANEKWRDDATAVVVKRL
jgi:sigma-B regulation protein RsbU (phosphoserine phosphatase)